MKSLSIRAGMRVSGYDVSLFVANALNYHTPIFVSRDFDAVNYGLPNLNTNYFGRGYTPRTIGVSATYKF